MTMNVIEYIIVSNIRHNIIGQAFFGQFYTHKIKYFAKHDPYSLIRYQNQIDSIKETKI